MKSVAGAALVHPRLSKKECREVQSDRDKQWSDTFFSIYANSNQRTKMLQFLRARSEAKKWKMCNTCNSSLVHTCTEHCVLNHFDWILYAGSIIRKSPTRAQNEGTQRLGPTEESKQPVLHSSFSQLSKTHGRSANEIPFSFFPMKHILDPHCRGRKKVLDPKQQEKRTQSPEIEIEQNPGIGTNLRKQA